MELVHNGIRQFGCGKVPPSKTLGLHVTCLRCLRKMHPGKNERDLNLVVAQGAVANHIIKQQVELV